MASIVEHVRLRVSAKTYYEALFRGAKWLIDNELRVKCIFHDDSSPSLYVNGETGAWYCHGCEAGGKSIVSFHAKQLEVSHEEAAVDLYHTHIRPIIPDKLVRKWVRTLQSTPTALAYLRNKRALSEDVITRFQIGFDGFKLVIPVRNEFGLCVNAKLYDPNAKAGKGKRKMPKMLNYKREDEPRSYGSPPMLYPVGMLGKVDDTSEIFICEGEWDALALISLGLVAVTSTAGCKSWPSAYNERFRNRSVSIAYDNDEDGRKYDKVPLKQLVNTAKVIKRVKVPPDMGKDVTDWLLKDATMRSKGAWLKRAKKASVLIDNPASRVEKKAAEKVPLNEASSSQYFNQTICVDALVTGKDTAPYYVPSRYRVSCNKSCEECPLAEAAGEYREREVDQGSSAILDLIDCPKPTMTKMLLKSAGFAGKPGCQCKVDVLEVVNIEHLLLIPTLESASSQYVMRPSYYVGHGLHTNRAYRFEGTTVPHPRDQHTTHFWSSAKPVQGEIDTFELTERLKHQLKRFQPKRLKPLAHLMSLAEWQSRNITKIRQRPDLHLVIDLSFHSVAAFNFNGEHVKRGMLDILVLGDTRCGKGCVTEGLKHYYGLGEMASGENCTFAGLIGGVQQAGNKWFITWGLIPLNHGRWVGIDEASALSESEIGHMSRVRSEGVAEIVKIVRESTQANTRLVWLSNTRSGRPIMSYNTGVEAIKELIGANEDISRFDLCLTVANNEVPSDIINSVTDYATDDADKFPNDLCRSLILWAWSRKADQIVFSDEATKAIIATSIELGRQYSSSIPLVQAENIRIKIAKIAAAIAARVFSTDEECERLLIEEAHVVCARQVIQLCYTKPSMGYDVFSRTAAAIQTIDKPESIDSVLSALGSDKHSTITGLIELHRVTPDTLADYCGDNLTAKNLIGELVRIRCLTRIDGGNWYLKNPAFSAWLRAHRRKAKNATVLHKAG